MPQNPKEEPVNPLQKALYYRKPFTISTSLLSRQQAAIESNDSKRVEEYASQYGTNGADDMLVCAVNPREMTISPRLRGSYDRSKNSTCYHDWPGITGRKLDTLQVNFTFQSGNILPHYNAVIVHDDNWISQWKDFLSDPFSKNKSPDTSDKYQMPIGIDMYYKFNAILDQPKTLYDGSHNLVIIETTSRLLPNLTMEGFFDNESIAEITQSADDPNQITWSASFMATRTSPSLDSLGNLRSNYRAALAELIPIAHLASFYPGSAPVWWKAALDFLLQGEPLSTSKYTQSGWLDRLVPDVTVQTGG